MLDKNDYQVILTLLSRVQITGQEATAVAILQQKLNTLSNQMPVENSKGDEDTKPKK